MSEAEPHDRRGFRFVDLLVAAVLLVILIGLLSPAVVRVRDLHGLRLKCQNNLKQIGLAAVQANDQFQKLPPMFGIYAGKATAPNQQFEAAGYPSTYPASLWYHLLPYIEESAIWERHAPVFNLTAQRQGPAPAGSVTIIIDSQNPSNNPATGDYDDNAASKRVPIYLCPSDDNQPSEGYFQLTGTDIGASVLVYDLATGQVKFASGPVSWGSLSYAANALIFAQPAPRLDAIPDGTSHTLLFTEKLALCRNPKASPSLIGGNLWSFPPYFGATMAGTVYDYAGVFAWSGAANKLLLTPFGKMPPPGFQVQPRDGSCDPRYPSSPHKGGINICMADGSVRFISDEVWPATWQAALTPGPIPGITYPAGGAPASDHLGPDWDEP